jgi:hypothetical protein
MPVLEKLGLVTSSSAVIEIRDEDQVSTSPGKRYRLTDEGRRFYRTGGAPTTGENRRREQGDLCAAKLSLDKLIGWEVSGPREHPEAVVTYTYKADAAPWTREPEVQRVFPAVDRVVRGAGTAELKETFTLTSEGWVAVDLLGERPTAKAEPSARAATSIP